MEQKRMLSVVSQLVIAVALVAAMAAFGLSQTPEKTDATLTNTEDSLRQARRAKLKELSKAKRDTITGWLILDGELIPGPYDVVITDNSILVNGLVVVAPPPKQENIAVDPKYVAHHELSIEMHTGYDSVYVEKGGGEAQKWVYEFLQNHPLVDTVYPSKFADLAYKFVDDKYPNHVTFLPPEDENAPTREEILKETLQWYGARLGGSLSHGSLVIRARGSGGGTTIPFPRSRLKMDELIRIAATIPDLEERVAAIKKTIGNNDQARLIAERFNIEQAEVLK